MYISVRFIKCFLYILVVNKGKVKNLQKKLDLLTDFWLMSVADPKTCYYTFKTNSNVPRNALTVQKANRIVH